MNIETEVSDSLAAFQATLLDVLHAGGTPAEMRDKLAFVAKGAGMIDYVAGFDERMLIVASELVRKWGAKV